MQKGNNKPYKDQSRFPKVIEGGYEKELKQDYDVTLKKMLIELAEKMVEFNNHNLKNK